MRFLAVGLAVLLLLGAPAPARAASVDDVEHLILDLVNEARNERGLTDLRASTRLWSIAAYRAWRMASTNVLNHSIGGSISAQLRAKSFPWYAYGEDVGYSPQKGATAAAKELFKLWKASPSHWALMMSSKYNYVGIGMSLRKSNGRWYSSIVFTESPDLTGARAAMIKGYRSGDDVTWTWRGWDIQLATHTSGLDDFKVQLRKDRGAWRTISKRSGATGRTVRDLAGGHWYGMRVRARDHKGNTGPYTAEIRVWVP